MRGWMNDTRSYIPPVDVGAVMRGAGGGTGGVLETPRLQRGRSCRRGLRCSGMGRLRRQRSDPGRSVAGPPAHLSGGIGDDRADRVLRIAGHRRAQGRRNRGGLGGGRCRWDDRRSDRKDQGLPGRRYRRGSREMQLHRRRARLRCRHRLQERGCPDGAQEALSGPHRRLFRQRRGRDPRHRVERTGKERAHRDLWSDLAVQQRRADEGTLQLHVPARESRHAWRGS